MLTRVDLPEPETPATAVNWPKPKSTSKLLMLRALMPWRARGEEGVWGSSASTSVRLDKARAVGVSAS